MREKDFETQYCKKNFEKYRKSLQRLEEGNINKK